MFAKRLIDASVFDRLIISVPEDVYDPQSYIRGVEDILYLIRSAETLNNEEEEIQE